MLSRFWLGSSPGGETWCRMVWVVTMELFPWWLLLEDSASLAGCWLYLTPTSQQEGNRLSKMRKWETLASAKFVFLCRCLALDVWGRDKVGSRGNKEKRHSRHPALAFLCNFAQLLPQILSLRYGCVYCRDQAGFTRSHPSGCGCREKGVSVRSSLPRARSITSSGLRSWKSSALFGWRMTFPDAWKLSHRVRWCWYVLETVGGTHMSERIQNWLVMAASGWLLERGLLPASCEGVQDVKG